MNIIGEKPRAPKRKPIRRKQLGLRLHPKGKLARDRLPFVGDDHGKHSCWDVPLTGSFFGACETGKTMAHLYLKYVRDEKDNPVALGGTLLCSMLKSLTGKESSNEAEEKIRVGQLAGFVSELSNWLKGAACELGSSLDHVGEQQLVDRANHWLSLDEANFSALINSSSQAAKE
jgi:hypothetical protein